MSVFRMLSFCFPHLASRSPLDGVLETGYHTIAHEDARAAKSEISKKPR